MSDKDKLNTEENFFEEVDVNSVGKSDVSPLEDFENNVNEVVVEDVDFFSETDTTNLFSPDDEITEQQNRNFQAFKTALETGEVDLSSVINLPGVKLEMVDSKDDLGINTVKNPELSRLKEITPGQGEDFFDVHKEIGIRKPDDVEDAIELPEFNAITNLPKNSLVTPQTIASSYILSNFVGSGKRELTQGEREELSLYQLINRFRMITDNNKSFEGFSVSGKYDFDNYPIVQFDENFAMVLEPKILIKVLVTLCHSMRLPSLHACQLGLKYDVFVIAINREQYAEFFNAELLGVSESGNKENEISGSFPGLSFKIERPNYVEAIYLNSEEEVKEHRIDDDIARYFLQNWSLTRGKTIKDIVPPLQKAMAEKKRQKLKDKIEGKKGYETY